MDSTTSDIPRDIADIIINLNIIKQIPTNHKLNVSTKTYVHADSKIDAFVRWWRSETGDSTVDFINETIDNAIKVCKKHVSWTEHIAECVNDISNALLNLEQIYKRNAQEATVGRIGLVKVRIEKDRFLRTCKDIKILTSDIFYSDPEASPVKIENSQSKPLPIPKPIIRTGPSGITASLTPDPRCHSCSHTPSPAPI